MNERIKTTVTDTIQTSATQQKTTTKTTTRTKISGFVTCFQCAEAKNSLKLSNDEGTD
jgi:hypothetical protein